MPERRSAIRFLRHTARWTIHAAKGFALRLLSCVTGSAGPARGWLPTIREAALASRGKYIAVDDAEDPETGVGILPGGHVLFEYGVVLTRNRLVVGGASPQFGRGVKDHVVMRFWRLPNPVQVGGTLAVLSSPWQEGYYHWMLEVLPRFDVLLRSNVPFDRVCTNLTLSFQRETLRKAGLDLSTILEPNPRSHFYADALIVPSIRAGSPTRQAVRYLRALYPSPPSTPHRNLYISRNDADARRVLNETELDGGARTGYGFERIELSRTFGRRPGGHLCIGATRMWSAWRRPGEPCILPPWNACGRIHSDGISNAILCAFGRCGGPSSRGGGVPRIVGAAICAR